jgi:hypothetical protein
LSGFLFPKDPKVDFRVPSLPGLRFFYSGRCDEAAKNKMDLPLKIVIPGPFPLGFPVVNILGGFIDMEDDLFLQRKIDIESRARGECVVLDRLVCGSVINVRIIADIAQNKLGLSSEGPETKAGGFDLRFQISPQPGSSIAANRTLQTGEKEIAGN